MTSYVFKIRHKKTGLFSTGGMWPSWNKKGKSWPTTQSLNLHMSQFKLPDLIRHYSDAETVAFEMVERDTMDITEVAARAQKKADLYELHKDLDFANLIDRIYNAKEEREYRWIVYLDYGWKTDDGRAEMLDAVRRLKIKRADYRYNGTAFIFRNKRDASVVRLSVAGDHPSFAYDADTLMETNLDDAA